MKQLIGQTASGREVYVELIGSEAGKQIAYQPYLYFLAKEMLAYLAPPSTDTAMEYNMQRSIGYSAVIATTDESIVFYGRLFKDDIFTRLVKNAKPETSQYLSIQLIWNQDGSYDLTDMWIGRLRPPRPGSSAEIPQSKPYWTTHAVVYGDQRLEMSSVTKECPYK